VENVGILGPFDVQNATEPPLRAGQSMIDDRIGAGHVSPEFRDRCATGRNGHRGQRYEQARRHVNQRPDDPPRLAPMRRAASATWGAADYTTRCASDDP
jgi:hypothetical protein